MVLWYIYYNNNKNELKTEKEEVTSLRRIVRYQQILIDRMGELMIFPHMKKGGIEMEIILMLDALIKIPLWWDIIDLNKTNNCVMYYHFHAIIISINYPVL